MTRGTGSGTAGSRSGIRCKRGGWIILTAVKLTACVIRGSAGQRYIGIGNRDVTGGVCALDIESDDR